MDTDTSSEEKIIILTHHNWIDFAGALHGFKLKNVTLVIPNGLYPEAKINKLRFDFDQVIEVKNYFGSSEVEYLCYTLLKNDPNYVRIIAPSEKDLLRAARLRDTFGLDGQPYDNAMIFRDKILMKTIANSAGIKVAPYAKVNSFLDIITFTEQHGYPVILKPIYGSGSEKTIKVDSYNALEAHVEQGYLGDELCQSGFIVEKFVHGIIYQMDGILEDGQLTISWPSKCTNNWLEIQDGKVVGRYLLPSGHPMTNRLNEYTKNVVKAFPLPKEVAFHIEVFHENTTDELIFCEIASRVGGIRAGNIWKRGFGFNIQDEFVRIQAGIESCIGEDTPRTPGTLAGYLLFPSFRGSLKHIETTCPFTWVDNYTVLKKVDDPMPKDICSLYDISSAVVFYGNNEKQILSRVTELIKWQASTTVWATELDSMAIVKVA